MRGGRSADGREISRNHNRFGSGSIGMSQGLGRDVWAQSREEGRRDEAGEREWDDDSTLRRERSSLKPRFSRGRVEPDRKRVGGNS